MRKTIYLIRHAESQKNANPLSNVLENGLTEIGIKQAHQLARKIGSKPLDKIFTSNSLRARQTANEFEKRTGIKPVGLEHINERKSEYVNEKEFIYTESFTDLKTRLEQTKDFLENSPHSRMVIVSHAGFIKALSLYLIMEEFFNEVILEKMEKSLVVGNASIVKLIYNVDKKKWIIDTWNDETHLSWKMMLP